MDFGTFEELKDKLNLSRISRPALIGIAVILVLVAGAGGRLLLTSTATASDFSVTREEAGAGSEADRLSGSEEEGDGALYVHISGAVGAPGLVELPCGARVADAVSAAGGFTVEAMQESVNLARPLEDGEQLKVMTQAEYDASRQVAQVGVQGDSVGGMQGEALAAASDPGKVNINTADEARLTTLPGIGESTARKIVADRTSNGPFSAPEDIKRVSGIGEKKYEAISGLICV